MESEKDRFLYGKKLKQMQNDVEGSKILSLFHFQPKRTFLFVHLMIIEGSLTFILVRNSLFEIKRQYLIENIKTLTNKSIQAS